MLVLRPTALAFSELLGQLGLHPEAPANALVVCLDDMPVQQLELPGRLDARAGRPDGASTLFVLM